MHFVSLYENIRMKTVEIVLESRVEGKEEG
jgi:hypothetical protein